MSDKDQETYARQSAEWDDQQRIYRRDRAISYAVNAAQTLLLVIILWRLS